MPTNTYYVAENLATEGQYIKELDEHNEPVWTTYYSEAEWSLQQSKVEEYINRFEINAKPKNPGFNYPPTKPPLP